MAQRSSGAARHVSEQRLGRMRQAGGLRKRKAPDGGGNMEK